MFRHPIIRQLALYAAFMLAFSIPFPFVGSSILIIINVVLWVASADFRLVVKRLRASVPLWFFILFYLLHLVSYFYSADKGESIYDLQSKLSFIMMPLAIGCGLVFTGKELRNVLLSFVFGVSVAALFCFMQAGFRFMADHDSSHFFYHDLVTGLDANAVYSSWYVFFSMLLLFINKDVTQWGTQRKWLYGLIITIQVVFFVLLSARTMMVLFVFLVVPYILYGQYRLGNKKPVWAIAAVSVVGIAAILFTHNPVRTRFQDLMKTNVQLVWSKDYEQRNKSFNNMSLRIFLWKTSLECMQENHLFLWGSGNGDYHELMNRQLDKSGIKDIYNLQRPSNLRNVNLHNMYLQTFFMLGIPGLICLIIMVLFPFYKDYRMYLSADFLLFNISAIIYFLQEAALHTYAGILPYCFFYALYINAAVNRKLHLDELK